MAVQKKVIYRIYGVANDYESSSEWTVKAVMKKRSAVAFCKTANNWIKENDNQKAGGQIVTIKCPYDIFYYRNVLPSEYHWEAMNLEEYEC